MTKNEKQLIDAIERLLDVINDYIPYESRDPQMHGYIDAQVKIARKAMEQRTKGPE